jgi:hypothetical protein
MRFIGAYYTIFSHDGEGAEVAEEAVLEDAVAEERIDANGIGLHAKADECLEARGRGGKHLVRLEPKEEMHERVTD